MRRIDTTEGPMLGIPTGMGQRRFGATDTVGMKKIPGFIVGPDGSVTDWPITKFAEDGGEMVALCPWPGESREWDPGRDGPEFLVSLLQGITALAAVGYPLRGFHLRMIRVLEGGGIIIAPPVLADWILANSSDEETAAAWEPWNHPDLKGEESWSFSLGMLAWHLTDGNDPCGGETGEDRRERIRREAIPSILLSGTPLSAEAAAVIDASLAPGKEKRPGLDKWRNLVRHWKDRTTGTPEETAGESAAAQKSRRHFEQADRMLRAMRWARKSLWKYLLAAAIAAGVLVFIIPPLTKALEKPVTAGMSPLQVVETYYAAIDGLDSQVMDDCLARKVGKADRQHVDMVFVTYKVRQGYEGIADPPRAEDWLEAGCPEITDNVMPWGVTGLGIEESGSGRFIVEYSLWYPGSGEGAPEPTGENRVDIITLGEGRRSWEIMSIERTVTGVSTCTETD